MLFYITLLFAIALVGTNPINITNEDPDGRIVGGKNADIRNFPHQISLQYYGYHKCGGSILEKDVVITAAHCLNNVNIQYLSVAAGSSYWYSPKQRIYVKYYIKHDWYNAKSHDYDIAVLFLNGNLSFNKDVKRIKLSRSLANVGKKVTVTGWGHTKESGSDSNRLQQVDVKVISNGDCQKSYPKEVVTSRMICAGEKNGGKDACQNDSGGPMVYNGQLLGIVSWGYGCGRKGQPGVYTSVPNLYSWILDNVYNGDL